MPSSRPRQRFQDILDNIDSIETYTAGMTFDQFAADDKTRDAVERCFSRIAEAAAKLDELAEGLAPGEPWAEIRAFGNQLRHAYDGIREELVWGIIQNRLQSLKAACQRAIDLIGPE